MHFPSNTLFPVVLGLLAAIVWGAADFAGGLATRRAPPSRVVLIAHGVSFLLLGLLSFGLPTTIPLWGTVAGLLSGIAGGVALMLFYEALSIGAMGLSAALAGLLTAVLPVIIATRTQGAPAPMQITGFAVAAAAIVLIAYAPPAKGAVTGRRALLFSVLAGCGFGMQLVWLHMAVAAGTSSPHTHLTGAALDVASHSVASHGHAASNTTARALTPVLHAPVLLAPVLRALLLSRFGGVLVAGGAQLLTYARRRNRLLPPPTDPAPATILSKAAFTTVSLPALAVSAGLLDTSGNGFYMLSSLTGRLDVAAVLSSLYPGGTILLAAIFLRERATRLQTIGMACALVAVALIAS